MSLGLISCNRILEALGYGLSKRSVISTASLAVLCLFYVYTIGTYFQVRIYPLVDRVTYYSPFNFFIVNEYVDHVIIGGLFFLWVIFSLQKSKVGYGLASAFVVFFMISAILNNDSLLDAIALASLPSAISILIYGRYSKGLLHLPQYDLIRNYLAIIGIITGLVSFTLAISSIVYHHDGDQPVIRSYAHDIFLLLSTLSPILLLLLIACFPVKLLIDFILRHRRQQFVVSLAPNTISVRKRIIFLSLFALLSIIIAIIPHLPTVNENNQQVGVDTGYYVTWVNGLNNSTSIQDFFYQAFVVQGGNGDRPISLIFLFMLNKLTNADLFFTVEYAPVILGPALVLAVYFLTRELTSNDTASLLAAFLTAVSFHTLIGIYAGFYANWLALVFGYISFVFLFRFLKKGGRENLVIYGALLLLTLPSHVYTWTILAIVTGVFLGVMFKMNQYSRRNTVLLFIALLSTVGIDLAKMSIIGSSAGIEEDIRLAGSLAGPEQFALRWNNLNYTVTTFVGGLFANFIALGLGLYWLFRAKMKDPATIFLIVFLSIGILPFLFGEWVIQTRVFYDIPFQIPAAIALFWIGRHYMGAYAIYIWLVAMAVVAVSNFYLISPFS